MGNHLVGEMFNNGVSYLSETEIDNLTPEQAFKILDKIGETVIKTTSLDAEFDDYLNPNEKLGKILIKAYLPEKYNRWKEMDYIEDEIFDEWWEEVKEPFKERFGFW